MVGIFHKYSLGESGRAPTSPKLFVPRTTALEACGRRFSKQGVLGLTMLPPCHLPENQTIYPSITLPGDMAGWNHTLLPAWLCFSSILIHVFKASHSRVQTNYSWQAFPQRPIKSLMQSINGLLVHQDSLDPCHQNPPFQFLPMLGSLSTLPHSHDPTSPLTFYSAFHGCSSSVQLWGPALWINPTFHRCLPYKLGHIPGLFPSLYHLHPICAFLPLFLSLLSPCQLYKAQLQPQLFKVAFPYVHIDYFFPRFMWVCLYQIFSAFGLVQFLKVF